MIKPSNVYAEKIYAENPISLWALDDKADFVSLFDRDNQKMVGWTVAGGTVTNVQPSGFSLPITDSPSIKVNAVATDEVTLTSESIANFNSLDVEKDSFNFSFFFNPRTSNVFSVKIGYTYETLVGGNVVTLGDSETFTTFVENSWVFLNKTFKIPKSGTEYLDNTFKTFIEIITTNSANYEYFINGLSLGQWSEPFHTESSGTVLEDLPSNISLPATKAAKAFKYGTVTDNGYYLASDRKMYAYNEGFPLVYGASTVTRIVPNETTNLPSLIVPGLGVLNESGKYREYTVEMWLRVNPETENAKRIFGPISSTDGIYVDGKFLILKVGGYSASHFVGEWGRPMLVQLVFGPNGAGVVLNGERVASIAYNASTLSLPESSLDGKSQDWLGFYAYENEVTFFDIDCVAIYSYQVPDVIAKRRFVFGQGVEVSSNSNVAFGGTTASIDYQISGYTNNYLYPDMGRWSQGISDNILTDANALSSPNFSLPSVNFKNQSISLSSWLELCQVQSVAESENLINLSLANSETNQGGYLFFEKNNPLSQPLRGFYGVFKSSSVTTKQVLFRAEHQTKGDYLEIFLQGGAISCFYSIGGTSATAFVSQVSVAQNTKFVFALDIRKFSNFFGSQLSSFFNKSSKLSLYVGGYKDFLNSFSGNIYSVGFSTSRNFDKLNTTTLTNGSFVGTDTGAYQNYIASYTLKPQTYLGDYVLDISADSYWQDYVPLTYFGKNVIDRYGDTRYSLDFLQINIDIPTPTTFDSGSFDTSDSEIKTYLSFQPIASGANKTSLGFAFSEEMPADGVIVPDAQEWINTKYEFVNDCVVYFPPDINFKEIALVVHVEAKSKNAYRRKFRIRSLQMASQALNKISSTPVNTKFTVPLVPFVRNGVYEDYEYKNPYSISKETSPYLYLNNSSGIRLRGSFNDPNLTDRGIRMEINNQRSSLYNVGAIQLVSKYTESLFPETPIEIYRINSFKKSLSVYVKADNLEKTRGEVYVTNTITGLRENGVTLYLNGVPSKSMFIGANQWNMIGMQFTIPLDFSNFKGDITLTGPMLFDNISEYRIASSDSANAYIFRTWGQILSKLSLPNSANNRQDDDLTPDIQEDQNRWNDFISSNPVISWENVLFIPTERVYRIDPASIYKVYVGTNKFIVSSSDVLRLNLSYRMYKDVKWSTQIISPV
jgi:hypothetical protein